MNVTNDNSDLDDDLPTRTSVACHEIILALSYLGVALSCVSDVEATVNNCVASDGRKSGQVQSQMAHGYVKSS